MFKKILDQGQAGDNIGCLLRGIKRDEISRGQVLSCVATPRAPRVCPAHAQARSQLPWHCPVNRRRCPTDGEVALAGCKMAGGCMPT
jgi:hypothetical protein|eukprot:COSAG01_NODE_92_length_27199_cov_100.594649_16_plen_87_part_00